MKDLLGKTLSVVTEHNLLVILLMLVLSGGVVYGVTDLQQDSRIDENSTAGQTEVAQKADYIEANYGVGDEENESATEPAVVYVRDEDGNALSKSALLDSLRYQRDVRDNESVAAALDGNEVVGVANLVATRAADAQDPSLDEQIAALEAAGEEEVETIVASLLREDSPALDLLPSDHEPGSAAAASQRMIFQFDADASEETRTAATKALFDAAAEHDDPEFFTVGEHANAEIARQQQQNMVQLILPAALLAILAVLTFAYRDLVDVIVGFAGVILSVLWMFGILGWLQIPAGMTMIIGPVLVVGLSVDYGLHVFMRYREQRGEGEGIKEPMHRGLSSVALALLLVTLTTAVGFMSNVFNELGVIRELAIGITLGVLSAFVIFVTIVPALKVTVDGLLERLGLDRRKAPLGKSGLVEPLLASGATLAKKGALAVVVVALVAGAAGGYAWTDLDRQGVQQDEDGIAEWKQNLPGPLAWEITEHERQSDYVDEHYRAADEDRRRSAYVLVEGDVTDPAALERVDAMHERAAERDVIFDRNGAVPLQSPLALMETVAAQDSEFAAVYEDADTDGNGVPDRNVDAVYGALYDAAPEQAAQVVERTDGEYRSLMVTVPIQQGVTFVTQATAMQDVAAAGEVDDGAVTTTAVGTGTLNQAELSRIADSVLTTLLIALGAVFVMLTVAYRLVEGSATLGAVTVVPISLVTAFVVGGMWLLDMPLTLLTALLMSLVIGLSIDYNIHISDRFAQELERGRSVQTALREAVTGTGGALLGSTLTSVGAFSALLLHPHPQLTSFGTLVVLALSLSFVVSVFVLPSLLLVWARLVLDGDSGTQVTPAATTPQD